MKSVGRPVNRSRLRRFLGREYYILRRRLKWTANKRYYASLKASGSVGEHISLIRHSSLLLRPLKDVDMQLQHNKITNLRLAISRINNIVIRPGEKMSVWKLVGRPTSSKGYLDGLVLRNGETTKGVGGGLCQLGNLLYWMALHTQLDVAERWRHSFDVFPDINRTIPFGCGATLAYNYIDLVLENNTDSSFIIKLWLDETHLQGEILCDKPCRYSYSVKETDHAIVQQWWGGYTRHNKIWKQMYGENGDLIDEILVAQNHAIMMYRPLLDQGTRSVDCQI